MKQSKRRMPRTLAERFAALSRVGTALMQQVDEAAVLRLSTQTALELIGAAFAAVILRPVNKEHEEGEPLVPSEGAHFQLAVVVGATQEQEAVLHRVLLTGEELFAPLFQQGRPVRVADIVPLFSSAEAPPLAIGQDVADQSAVASAQGRPQEEEHSQRLSAGHAVVRSFLGAPLFDHVGQVRGGVLLGHSGSGKFRQEDETLLMNLAAQTALALERARLAQLAELRDQQRHAVLDESPDAASLLDTHGSLVRESGAARQARERLQDPPEGEQAVTARLQEAEREARQPASQLEAVFEAVPEALVAYDREGRITQMNAAGHQLYERLGLTDYTAAPMTERAAQVAVWDNHGQILAKGSFPISRILVGEVLGPAQAVEISLLDRQAERVSLSITGGPLRDAQGQLVGAVVIARDTTRRQHLEQALQQQAQQRRYQLMLLDKLLERAHDAILVRDPHNRIRSWNRGAEKLYGWTAPEVLGQVTHELLQTRFPVSLMEVETHLERDGQWEGELWHTCRDGTQVLVESRWVLVRDVQGVPTAILEINRNMTERHRLQQQLQEAERQAKERVEQLEAIFEAVPDGVFVFDSSGAIVQMNTAGRRLLGFDVVPDHEKRPWPERLAGYAMRDWQGHVLASEQWPLVHLLTGEVLTGPNTREVLLQSLNGSEIQASIAGTTLHDQDGQVTSAVMTVRDLSERYRLERRLEEAEHEARERANQLEAVLEAMPEALFVSDREGRTTRMNTVGSELAERLGFTEAVGTPFANWAAQVTAWDEHGQPLAKESFPNAHILAGEVLSPAQAMEITLLDRQGERVCLSVTGGPLRDTQADFVGAVMICRDITERNRAERTLRRQARQLQLQAELIERAHDAILVRDPHSRILSWNRGAEYLYGWTAQEALGRVTHGLLQTRIPVNLADVQAHLEREGQWEGELRHRCRDGTEVLVESHQVLVRDAGGQPTAILEINRDITQRHRLEALQRQMQAATETQLALLQLVLDELPSSVCLVHGLDARLILANHAATALWGAHWTRNQPLSEFLQENGIRILGLDGKVLPPEQGSIWLVLREGQAVYQYQEIICQPNGQVLPVLLNAVPIKLSPLLLGPEQFGSPAAEGAEPAALVVYQDVTALKEAERLKDEFIGIATHELRTPLAVLSSAAQTLRLQRQQGRGVPLDEWQREALATIEEATQQLVALSEALLDITRLQGGRLQVHPEPVDLVALSRRVIKRLQRTTQRHRLSLGTSQDQLILALDPGRIEQVLTNLLSNAIKYSPQGGPVEVTIRVEREAGAVVLSVRDEGIGIPAQQQAAIFGRFVRASNARGIAGTGLGLYLCRSLVELHGGRLWFESIEGRGSTFLLALSTDRQIMAPD